MIYLCTYCTLGLLGKGKLTTGIVNVPPKKIRAPLRTTTTTSTNASLSLRLFPLSVYPLSSPPIYFPFPFFELLGATSRGTSLRPPTYSSFSPPATSSRTVCARHLQLYRINFLFALSPHRPLASKLLFPPPPDSIELIYPPLSQSELWTGLISRLC